MAEQVKLNSREKAELELDDKVKALFEQSSNKTEVKFLGAGAYAKVYKVRYKGIIRACKVIQLKDTAKNYKFKFLPREMEILMKPEFRNDNIIAIKEIKKDKKIVLIYMEFAEGGPVSNLLKNGPVPEQETKRLFTKICDGLFFMHRQGIAHRAIKLENILLDKNKNPKLTDFSYAIVCTTDEKGKEVPSNKFLTKTYCGTKAFMSPEIMELQPYNPLAADIWALGICLYVLVTGRIPFSQAKDKAIIEAQKSRKLTFNGAPE